MYEMVACFRLQGLYIDFFFNYILNIIRIFRTLTPDIGKHFFLTKSWLTLAAGCWTRHYIVKETCLWNRILRYVTNESFFDCFLEVFSKEDEDYLSVFLLSYKALQKVAENNVAFFPLFSKNKITYWTFHRSHSFTEHQLSSVRIIIYLHKRSFNLTDPSAIQSGVKCEPS